MSKASIENLETRVSAIEKYLADRDNAVCYSSHISINPDKGTIDSINDGVIAEAKNAVNIKRWTL